MKNKFQRKGKGEESWIFYIRFDFLIRMTKTDRIYTVDQLMTPSADDAIGDAIDVTIWLNVISRDLTWFHVWQYMIDYIRSSREHN